MLTTSSRDRASSGEALTHQRFLDACCTLREPKHPHGQTWVQVQRWHSQGPVTLCAQVVGLRVGDDGTELFKVRTAIDEGWTNGRRVRLCSHDGHCTCAPDDCGPPSRGSHG